MKAFAAFLILCVLALAGGFAYLQFKPQLTAEASGQSASSGHLFGGSEDPADGLFTSLPPVPEEAPLSRNLYQNVSHHERSVFVLMENGIEAQKVMEENAREFNFQGMNQAMAGSLRTTMLLSSVMEQDPFVFFNQAIPRSLFSEENYITPDKYELARTAYESLTNGSPNIVDKVSASFARLQARRAALPLVQDTLFTAVLHHKLSPRAHDLFAVLSNDKNLQSAVRDASLLDTDNRMRKAPQLLQHFRERLMQQQLTTKDLTALHDMNRWCVFAATEIDRVHGALDEFGSELSSSTDPDVTKIAAAFPKRQPSPGEIQPVKVQGYQSPISHPIVFPSQRGD